MELSSALKAQLGLRHDELVKARDTFVTQANLELAVRNGAIAELERLLEEPKPNETAKSNGVPEPVAAT